jgi:hypothetical protein
MRRRLSGVDDARERDTTIRPRRDQALHPELPPTVGQHRPTGTDDFHLVVERRRWGRRGARCHATPERDRRCVRARARCFAPAVAAVVWRDSRRRFGEDGRAGVDWERDGRGPSATADRGGAGGGRGDGGGSATVLLHVCVGVVRENADGEGE